MGYIAIILIAITEAMDCFAVSISTGLCKSTIPYSRAVLQSFSFGFFQGGMTLLGFFLGKVAERWVSAFGPYIACGILSILGLRMIRGAIREMREAKASENCDAKTGESRDDQAGNESEPREGASCEIATPSLTLKSIVLLSIATSIDAFAVGVSFAFAKVDLVFATAAIAIASFVIAQIGFEIGKRTARLFKTKVPEIIAGCILIGIGVKLLF